MLQQTTVAMVIPYFKRFLEKWPTLETLAQASLEEILVHWQGLGYYSRARNLHRCAGLLQKDYGGRFPTTLKDLKKLPGIGAYTAGALMTIAFNQPALVVDGNIIRVLSRFFALPVPYPASKKIIETHAQTLLPCKRPGDYVQALMDLGATVCTIHTPSCQRCPVFLRCKGFQEGNPAGYPIKPPAVVKPTRYALFFLIYDTTGRIFLRKRPEKGLLGGMMEVPSGTWSEDPQVLLRGFQESPFPEKELAVQKTSEVSHTFTHFHLKGKIFIAQKKSPCFQHHDKEGDLWILPCDVSQKALPTLMKKILKEDKISSLL